MLVARLSAAAARTTVALARTRLGVMSTAGPATATDAAAAVDVVVRAASSASSGGAAKLWGGRFSEPTDALVQRLNASVHFDRRLALEDIDGSLAHARMLSAQGIPVARRTVAKYREAIGIASSAERKRDSSR